ncbi:MAG: nucleoside hydrolase [Planctomycetes bacterium]|nr:nucleoside hydrolase [Planctomycetota bacterium]MCH9724611.1 nucleoside hydrolase [Planctomycetota bacterium]MCH9777900.1 nucleoside hydrolase [Planctomycetota bacterium]MCH9792278.1 nucleoside hydrolase [Planctomycetota bacterium]
MAVPAERFAFPLSDTVRSVLCLVLVSICSTLNAGEPTRLVPLIFDTDIGNDVDDVLALGMIHSLEARGDCKLVAVTITKDNPLAASFTDAVNTFYGKGEIPIGICRSGVTPATGKFLGLATKKDNGQLRYPHDLKDAKSIPDAVTVLRRALADAKDGSVVIAQVGFSTNLANLLKSPGDKISSLAGKELVEKKVKLLSIMAGAFTKIPSKGKMVDHREYNIVKDIPSAKTLAAEWPTPVVWSGFEIGLSAAYPHESIEEDYNYTLHHPLAEAYILYNPPPHDRPTWDLTSVLYAVFPHRGYFDLSDSGDVSVKDNGLTTFKKSDQGRHRYLKLNDLQRKRLVEALVQLSSQPPAN